MTNNIFNHLKFKLSFKVIILSFAIIFLPLYETITANFYILKTDHYINIIIFFFLVLLLVFILSLFLKKIFFFKKYSYLKLSIFVLLNFYFNELSHNLESYFNTFHNHLALIILILFYFFILFIFYKNEKAVIKFLSIYLLFNFLFLTYQFGNIIYVSKLNLTKEKDYEINEINFLKKKENKNIYYIIVDEMISLEDFEKKYNYNLDEYKNKFLNLDGIYFGNSNSIYDTTVLTLSSIFNLDYIAKDNQFFSYYSDRSFPNFLSKKNMKKENTNLVKILNKLQYKFWWIDNATMECSHYNKDLCIQNSTNNNLLINQTTFLILQRTVFYSLFFKYQSSKKTTFKRNNGIKRLMKYLENNKDQILNQNNFFFVHNFASHSPFLYNEDCKYKKNSVLKKINPEKDYEFAYFCTLKQIIKFIDYLKETDPNSIIVINADHGLRINKNLDHSVFNFVYPKKCINYKNSPNNQLDTIYVVINCISNSNFMFKEDLQFKSSNYKFNGNLQIKKKH